MNSFRFVAQGIDAEVARQIALYESGGEVVQETYDFDAAHGDADRAPLEGGGGRLPLLPRARPRAGRAARGARRAAARRAAGAPGARIRAARGTSSTSTAPSCSSPAGSTRLWEATVAAGAEPGRGGERDREPARRRSTRGAVDAARAGEARRGARPDPARRARRGARARWRSRASRPRRISRRRRSPTPPSWSRSSTRILEANPGQVAAYRGGKEGLLGFFVGQVMKETGGKANARVVSELVREKLAAPMNPRVPPRRADRRVPRAAPQPLLRAAPRRRRRRSRDRPSRRRPRRRRPSRPPRRPTTAATTTEPPPATTDRRRRRPSVVTIRLRVAAASRCRESAARLGQAGPRGRDRRRPRTSRDHVHLHGYDLMADVAPGRARHDPVHARRSPGRFEIELEDRGTPDRRARGPCP